MAATATQNGKASTPPTVETPTVETAQVETPTVDVAALIAAPAVRPPTYRVSDDAPSAAFGKQVLTSGVNVKAGTPCYVLVNGSAQVGFPQAAIAVAILEGLIPRDTIRALWAAADARNAQT